MISSGLSRIFAVLAACLLGFSSAGAAVAHAAAHAHLAADHGPGNHEPSAPHAVPIAEDGHHGHAHEHGSVDTAPTSRDGARLDVAPPALNAADALNVEAAEAAEAGAPPTRPPSLLPRPGPAHGPPSGPRAPPAS